MTPVDIDKLKELYQRATEPEPTNLVTHDSVQRPSAATNAMIWRDWHHRRALAARELLDLTPALIAKAERVDALTNALKPFAAEIDRLERDYGFDRPLHQGQTLMLPLSDLLNLRNALSPKESE